jgi:hypothetical protein
MLDMAKTAVFKNKIFFWCVCVGGGGGVRKNKPIFFYDWQKTTSILAIMYINYSYNQKLTCIVFKNLSTLILYLMVTN